MSKGRGQLQAAHPDGGCRSNQQQPAASARRQRGAEPALALRAGLCAPGRCCGTCPGRRRPRCCAGRWHPSCTRTTTASSPRGPTRTAPSSACAPCGSRCARARARGLHASAHAPPVPLRRRHTRAAQRFCAESGLRVYVSAPQRSQAASHRWALRRAAGVCHGPAAGRGGVPQEQGAGQGLAAARALQPGARPAAQPDLPAPRLARQAGGGSALGQGEARRLRRCARRFAAACCIRDRRRPPALPRRQPRAAGARR